MSTIWFYAQHWGRVANPSGGGWSVARQALLWRVVTGVLSDQRSVEGLASMGLTRLWVYSDSIRSLRIKEFLRDLFHPPSSDAIASVWPSDRPLIRRFARSRLGSEEVNPQTEAGLGIDSQHHLAFADPVVDGVEAAVERIRSFLSLGSSDLWLIQDHFPHMVTLIHESDPLLDSLIVYGRDISCELRTPKLSPAPSCVRAEPMARGVAGRWRNPLQRRCFDWFELLRRPFSLRQLGRDLPLARH